MRHIRRSIPRIEGFSKVTGQIEYVSDMEVPDMLYGKILRSPYPHAKILDINSTEAEKIHGVVSVINLKEPSGKNSLLPKKRYVEMPLYDSRVRHVGDEVVALAASDPDIAEEAIEQIEVDYEELPAIYDPLEALERGSPSIREGGNLAFHKKWSFGDVKRQMESATIHIRDHFKSQRQAHVCLETKGCIASWNRAGELTVISTTSAPHTLATDISGILDIEISKVRVINPPMGGSYGGRASARMVDIAACLLARKASKPVKIVNSREEEFISGRTRYPYDIDIELGADDRGKLFAWDVNVIANNGAYTDLGRNILEVSYCILEEGYNARSARLDAKLVYTNTQPGTAMRGFGEPQIVFAIESMMDELADKLQLNPVKVRLLNASRSNSTNYSGVKISSNGLKECIEKALKLSGWSVDKKSGKKGSLVTGYGMSIAPGSGGGPQRFGYQAEANLKVTEDGTITLVTSAVDLGTGAETLMAQFVAEILDLEVSEVRVHARDTKITAFDYGAVANRTSFIHGHAVIDAAERLKTEIIRTSSRILKTDLGDLSLKKGKVVSISTGISCSIRDANLFSLKNFGRPISATGRITKKLHRIITSDLKRAEHFPAYSFMCHIAKILVDTETGKLDVVKYVAVHDCGTVLNMLGARGQVCGNAVAGFGLAIMEDLVIEDGNVLNPNLMDYNIPSMRESPHIQVSFVETFEPKGPYGAKGLGDQAVSPVAAAITNAVCDATGVRIRRLPMKPERLLKEFENR